jgi:DNA-binding NarL/FixJ family response regulator
MVIKIQIADDHRLIREGIKAILDCNSLYSVIAESKNGKEAVESALKYKPDVILMDITMPELNGIDAVKIIMQKLPQVKIITITMHEEFNLVSDCFEAGAHGFLMKDVSSEELFEAIKTVHGNRMYVCSAMLGSMMNEYKKRISVNSQSKSKDISFRERQILQEIAQGKTTKQMARKMNISIKTVETHRSNIMCKLNIFSIAELTRYAIRKGLITLS